MGQAKGNERSLGGLEMNVIKTRRGFTIVELLVVITIIVLLAGMAMGAMSKARERGKLEATKATVAKLNDLVMKRYESYRTRRIPLNFAAIQMATFTNSPPAWAATMKSRIALLRTLAIRYYMLREMPQCWSDITGATPPPNTPAALPTSLPDVLISGDSQVVNPPGLTATYLAKYNAAKPNGSHEQAKCLYLWVTTSMPESRALFRPEEIATDSDGWKYFVDGWGNPISFIRWAPGATSGPKNPNGWSDIQIDDTPDAANPKLPNLHHDPFDPLMLQNGPQSFAPTALGPDPGFKSAAYQLYPLVIAGLLGKTNGIDDYGINLVQGININENGTSNLLKALDPYGSYYYSATAGTSAGAIAANGGVPLVHNHHMEQK
jgi:prepilin-type N-terminal cleavage/methylation domain-containing protein